MELPDQLIVHENSSALLRRKDLVYTDAIARISLLLERCCLRYQPSELILSPSHLDRKFFLLYLRLLQLLVESLFAAASPKRFRVLGGKRLQVGHRTSWDSPGAFL